MSGGAASAAAAARAADISRAYNVFHSREACLSVLRQVERRPPGWWNARCSAFVRAVEAVSYQSKCVSRADNRAAHSPVVKSHAIIVVEGLDGVGKSRTAAALAKRLQYPCMDSLEECHTTHGATKANHTHRCAHLCSDGIESSQRMQQAAYRTVVSLRTPPPEWTDVRARFDMPHSIHDEHLTRAFYSAANYLAAEQMMGAAADSAECVNASSSPASRRHYVIVDRWWCSTCAMALSHRCTMHSLPARQSSVYAWPVDLPMFDLGILLCVHEHVRQQRIERRQSMHHVPVTQEERKLAGQREMRAVAMEAYRRTGQLEEICVSNYREAVNAILTRMCERQLVPRSSVRMYSEGEVADMEPY